jgi:hypothetical protein
MTIAGHLWESKGNNPNEICNFGASLTFGKQGHKNIALWRSSGACPSPSLLLNKTLPQFRTGFSAENSTLVLLNGFKASARQEEPLVLFLNR